MNSNKAYLVLMTLLLTCIGIKYGVSKTDPFQQSRITAFETLLWILSEQLLLYSIINFLLLLLAIFFFFHTLTHLIISFINYVTHHLHSTHPNALQMPNIELKPHVAEAHV
ncbi:hypothetical protein V8G54_031630 [Vigna mungo]|uniref:Uncharacterized protein n=1 Tax=Vigna mungo TaxID=3915 RepID=A0AAQ3MK42_VIGMU